MRISPELKHNCSDKPSVRAAQVGMTGRTSASERRLAPREGGSFCTSDDGSSAGELTVVCEVPEGYAIPAGAAQAILRVMRNVAAREGGTRLPIGRAG